MKKSSKLNSRTTYLQIALNSDVHEARSIINQLPAHNRLILEAGTPLIKEQGASVIARIKNWYQQKILSELTPKEIKRSLFSRIMKPETPQVAVEEMKIFEPYIVADMKMMDRGAREVQIAARYGASAVTALGAAPIESLNAFIAHCEDIGLDSMIDMMNIDYPISVLSKLKKQPTVVILHRGVDEERDNREKQLPLYDIKRIKGTYDTMVAVAGGDTLKEAQRAAFNNADIVVLWKSFFNTSSDTGNIAKEFLKEVK